MRKILLTFLMIALFVSTPLAGTTPPNQKKTESEEINYFNFDDKSTEALGASMIAWGIALFVGIALAAGLNNGPTPTNTPDLQSSTTSTP
ncbi:MAG: hypothetical protein KGQ54_04900 [Verrucomicrobia bacterium]|nr:hypothetical protein [Verrucomicrobiota bacterium]